VSITNRQVLTRTLGAAAIALVSWVGGTAPSSADPNSGDTGPNPFGGLSCNCPTTAPPGGGTGREGMDRGFRRGLTGG
jgi:hypothetical protein